MAPQPVVTGLSPKEGPPGTRVTIRGEHLGTRAADLIGLTICGCDCLLSAEWKSPNKIIARSGPGKGRGDITVTTRSGGIGTSTVQFRGYHETIGPMKESAVWVEESPLHSLAWGRRSLAPPGYSQEDPLGLSTEGSDNKFPEDDLRELFPDSCGDLSSEQFSAAWFLLENHQNTSFEDLKAGLAFLKRKVEAQKEGQLSFLKANAGSVLEQLDTLEALRIKFDEDVIMYGNDPTGSVQEAIRRSIVEAEKIFAEVLCRREKADATRNALGALNRHRMLFLLPCELQKYAAKGDYDMLVNDYARARNLFGRTEVPIFRKVMDEVDKCVETIRNDLRTKLNEMPSTVDHQKRLIRALVHLESGGDPAWDALYSRANYLDRCLDKCCEEHLTMEADAKSKSPRSTPVPAVPPKVLFCEDLTECAAGQLPDLWRLGQAYFKGELQISPDINKPAQFKKMILNCIEKFTGALKKALIPTSISSKHANQQLGPWLSHCLHYVRAAYATLVALDLPSEALEIVCKLILDLRVSFLVNVFRQATEQVNSLPSKETWQLDHNGIHGGGTALSSELEKIASEALQAGHIALNPEIKEMPLEGAAQKEIMSQAQNMLLAFNGVLEELAFSRADEDVDELSPGVSQLMGPMATPWNDENNSWDASSAPWELRLLATIANCRHVTNVVLPAIAEMFTKSGYPALSLDPLRGSLMSLRESLLDTYTEHRSDPLVGTLEPSMYLGKFDWDRALPPTALSPYAQECIGNLLAVHAEVHRICPWLVHEVLSQIVCTVGEELARLMNCVGEFNEAGAIQATLDLTALRDILQIYSTPRTETFFNDAMEAVPKLNSKNLQLVKQLLNSIRSRMSLQLMCFSSNT